VRCVCVCVRCMCRVCLYRALMKIHLCRALVPSICKEQREISGKYFCVGLLCQICQIFVKGQKELFANTWQKKTTQTKELFYLTHLCRALVPSICKEQREISGKYFFRENICVGLLCQGCQVCAKRTF